MSLGRWRSVKQGLLLILLSPIIVLNVAATEPAAEPPPEVAYRQLAVWTEIGGDFQNFDQPCAVAVDSRRDIYIADCALRAVIKLDGNGKFLDAWKGAGEHRFFHPADIFIDVNDAYVVDRYERRVYRMSLSGEHKATWNLRTADAGKVGEATGICVDPLGKIYILDHVNDRILSYNSNGKLLKEFGKDLEGPAKLFGPTDIVCDDHGNVLVTSFNDRIVKFSPEGEVLAVWGQKGTKPGQFDDPRGLAMDPQGRLYLTDTDNGRLQRMELSVPEAPEQNGESDKKAKKDANGLLKQPQNIVVWGQNAEDGTVLEKPTGITVTPDGLVIVTDRKRGTITLWKQESPFALPKLEGPILP